ncbi:MAG: hypothetical protein U5N86_10000 [Planctomycetota bacterium]|nr:hypothetical protein [Planctomycetota bacterium]
MRRTLLLTISLLLITLSFPVCLAEQDEGWERFELSYSPDKSGFEDITSHMLNTPHVEGFVELPNIKNASGFIAQWENGELQVDTDGDGEVDETTRKPGLTCEMQLSSDAGVSYPYAVCFERYNIALEEKRDLPLLRWRRSCCVEGRVNGEQVRIFDDSANGKYDDMGDDSVAVGRSEVASQLSKLIVLGGELFEFRVDPFGRWCETRPYEGETGTFNAFDKFDKSPRLLREPLAFVVEHKDDSSILIDVARKNDCPVPVGEYELKLAILSDRVFVKGGESESVKVEAGKKAFFEWGGPYELHTKAWVENSGYKLEMDKSGARARYKQVPYEFPTVKIAFPVIKGEGGEFYVGNPLYKDIMGNCFADGAVQSFEVKIFNYKNRQMNKGEHRWKHHHNQGYGYANGYTFEMYQCPFKDFRGIAKVILKVNSKIFGDLEFETKLEVEYE